MFIIGYLQLQKQCACATYIPGCSDSGWKVTLAGFRYLTAAEHRYASVEGEALAVACGLEQTKDFTQGCDNLMVVTDHKPLVKIFGDQTLDEISNTRLFRLKQRLLMWRSNIAHVPGTTNSATNATSRHSVECDFIARIAVVDQSLPDMIEAALLAAVQQGTLANLCLQWSEIACETATNSGLKELLLTIQIDFLLCFSDTSRVRPYLPFRDGYYIHDGVILYQNRVVVPLSLRRKVLSMLSILSALTREFLPWNAELDLWCSGQV